MDNQIVESLVSFFVSQVVPLLLLGVGITSLVWKVLTTSREKVLRELYDIRKAAQTDRSELKRDILTDLSSIRKDVQDDFSAIRNELEYNRTEISLIRKEVSDLRYRLGQIEGLTQLTGKP